MQDVMNDGSDIASAVSSEAEQEGAVPDGNMGFGSHVTFWSKETLVSCVCGAPPNSYCTCLPTSLDFAPEGDNYYEETPMQHSHRNSTQSDDYFPATEPQVREDGRPAAPNRKEVLIKSF